MEIYNSLTTMTHMSGIYHLHNFTQSVDTYITHQAVAIEFPLFPNGTYYSISNFMTPTKNMCLSGEMDEDEKVLIAAYDPREPMTMRCDIGSSVLLLFFRLPLTQYDILCLCREDNKWFYESYYTPFYIYLKCI